MNNRYDFVFAFDVTDGNPNGDPDAGNLPRIDPETGEGLVSDVCLKRKVRNFVQYDKGTDERYKIYVTEGAILNAQQELATNALNDKGTKAESRANRAKWMCDNFYDIRTFGAVMNTGKDVANAGQVRGPVQLTFSRSVHPVVSLEHTITRCAVTREEDIEKQRTMGRKFTVSYGLYKCHGFVNPFFAEKTGFDEEDLSLFFASLQNLFELDRSAARGQMVARSLTIFKHKSRLGNAPAHTLQARVTMEPKELSANKTPRCYEDFDFNVNREDLPDGVSVDDERSFG